MYKTFSEFIEKKGKDSKAAKMELRGINTLFSYNHSRSMTMQLKIHYFGKPMKILDVHS